MLKNDKFLPKYFKLYVHQCLVSTQSRCAGNCVYSFNAMQDPIDCLILD